MTTLNLPILESSILIVDDNIANVELLEMMLDLAGYQNVACCTDSRQVTDLYLQKGFDLLLLDIRMPHLDGFQVMEKLAELTQDDYLPILILTAQKDMETRIRALEAGAKDFVTKPFDRTEVLNRIKNMLEVRRLYNERTSSAKILEDKVRERTKELHATRLEVIRRLGRAGEFRDNETGMHIIRMSKSCQQLALAAKLGESHAEMILQASPMHDVGKIGIPDRVLLKPGKLNDEEWAIMKQHPAIGAEIIGTSGADLMKMASSIAITHHEKWDGSGYPNGLKGEEIPIEGRITAIADVFDALTSERPYKKAWSVEKAVGLLKEEAGKHFDPTLVPIFLGILPEILQIGKQYADDVESFLIRVGEEKTPEERVVYKDEYVLGHKGIDGDHRKLFDLINAIHGTILEGDIEVCQRLFKSFHQLAANHFAQEEAVLKKINFSNFESHRSYHQDLLEKAKEAADKCAQMDDKAEVMSCFDAMSNFFIDDIIKGDMEFKEDLANLGSKNEA